MKKCSKVKKFNSMVKELIEKGMSEDQALKIGAFVSGKVKDTDEYSEALSDSISMNFIVDPATEDNDFKGNKTTRKSIKDVVKNDDGLYTDGSIVANESQTEFIDKFIQFANPANRVAGSAFSLSGLGGTGKTTSVSLAVRAAGFDDNIVVYSTHQNNAANILSEAVGKPVFTNFQVLQKVMKYDYKIGKNMAIRKMFTARDGSKRPTQTVLDSVRKSFQNNSETGLLIIDESSVLDENIIVEMIQEAKKFNFMILFMGDHHQLPPVVTDGRSDNGAESPLYSSMRSIYGDNHYTLTEKVRTDQNSDIAKISDVIVNQIDEDIYKTPDISGIDKGDGSVTYQPNVEAGLKEFSDQYRIDPSGTRLVTVNNSTHSKMKELSYKLRKMVFGEKNIQFKDEDGQIKQKFAKGELVIIDQNADISDGSPIATSETMYILSDEVKSVDSATLIIWYENNIRSKDWISYSYRYQDAIQEKHIDIIDGEMYLNLKHISESEEPLGHYYYLNDLPSKLKEVTDSTERENLIKLINAYKAVSEKIDGENELTDEEIDAMNAKITSDFRGKFKSNEAITVILNTSLEIPKVELRIYTGDDSVKIDFPSNVGKEGRNNILKFIKNEYLNQASSSILINAHKAQGATYRNVFVHMENVEYNAKMSFNKNPDRRGLGLPIINKALYVSVSRASKKLSLIGNSPIYGITNNNKSNKLRDFSYGFTVTPIAKPDTIKAVAKAKKSSQYIGFGKKGSSTRLYAEQANSQGVPVNSGKYSNADIVFASVNGTPTKEDFKSTLNYVVAALEAGAVVLLDSSEYISKSTYNNGERELAKALRKRGYESRDSKSKNFAAWKKSDVVIKKKPNIEYIDNDNQSQSVDKSELKKLEEIREKLNLEIATIQELRDIVYGKEDMLLEAKIKKILEALSRLKPKKSNANKFQKDFISNALSLAREKFNIDKVVSQSDLAEIESLLEEASFEMREVVDGLDEDIEFYRNELAKLKDNKKRIDLDRKSIELSIREKEIAIEKLDNGKNSYSISRKINTIKDLIEDIKKEKNKLNSTNKKLSEQEAQLNETQDETIARLEKKEKELDSKMKDAKKEKNDLLKKEEELDSKMKAAEKEKNDLLKEEEELLKKLAELDAKSKELKKANNNTKKEPVETAADMQKRIDELSSLSDYKKADPKTIRDFGSDFGADFGRVNQKTKELMVEIAKKSALNVDFLYEDPSIPFTMLKAAVIFSHPANSDSRAMSIEMSSETRSVLNDRTIEIIEEAIEESNKARARITGESVNLGSDAKMNFGKATETIELKSAEDFDAFLTDTLNNDNKSNTFMEELDDGSIVPSDSYREHLAKLKDILVDGIGRLYTNIEIDVEKRIDKKRNSHTQGSLSYNIAQGISDNRSTIKLLESGSSEISSMSEVVMHESIHAVIKGFLGKDRKMRNRIKSIHKLFLEAIKQEGYDHTMFLDQIKHREPTAYEINTAKSKFGYVFSETTNPEEFLAYALTNKALYELVFDMDKEYARELQDKVENDEFNAKQVERQRKGVLGEVSALFAVVIRSTLGQMKPFINSENAVDEMIDVMATIIDRKESTISNFQNSLWQRTWDNVGGFIPNNIIGKPVLFTVAVFSNVITEFNKQIGNLLSSKAVNRIKVQASRIYDYMIGSSPVKLVKSLRTLSFIQHIMHSDAFVSLQHRLFRSQYLSDHKELYNYAKQKNKIDSFVIALKVQIEKILKEQGKDTEKSSSSILNVHKAGLSRLAISSNFLELTRSIARIDKSYYRNELLSLLNRNGVSEKNQQTVIDKLDALAKYNANREVTENLIELNVNNILVIYEQRDDSLLSSRIPISPEIRKMAQGYSELSTLLNLDDTRFNQFKLVAGSESQKNLIKVLLSKERMYRKTFPDSKNGRTEIPDVLDISSSFNVGKTVRFGTRKQATALGSTMIDSGPIITLSNGVDIYRYATINYAPSVRDSVYEKTTSTVDGVLLRDVVARAMLKNSKKVKFDESFKNKLNEELNYLSDKYPELVLKFAGTNPNPTLYLLNDKAINEVIGSHNRTYSDELVNRISSLGREELVSEYNRKLMLKIAKSAIMKNQIPKGQEDSFVTLEDVIPDNPYASRMYVPRHIALLLSGSARSSLTNMNFFGFRPLDNFQGAKNVIGIAESLLSDVSSITKSFVVLLTPAVVAGNIASNLFAAMSMGVSPVDFAVRYIDRWKNFNEISELLSKRANILTDPNIKRDYAKDEITRIDALLEANPDYKLYSAGHISTSAESVETDISHANQAVSVTLYDSFRFMPKLYTKKEYDKKLKSVIEDVRLEGKIEQEHLINIEARKRLRKDKIKNMGILSFTKNIVKEVVVAEKSHMKDIANKNLIYSDSIAKSIILEHRIESGKANSLSEEYALLDDVFVNYDYAQGGLEQYLENIGQFLFLKYYSSSLKAAVIKAYTHKQGNIGFYGAEIATGVNIISPDDSFMKSSMYDAMANRNKFGDLFSNATLPMQAHVDDMFSIDNIYGSVFSNKMSLF